MDNKHKWIICNRCQGHGTVENSAFQNGFTSSEWAEMAADEQEEYMRGGYDEPCGACSGSGKVLVPNIANLTFAEKRQLVRDRREARADRQLAAEAAAERALGC